MLVHDYSVSDLTTKQFFCILLVKPLCVLCRFICYPWLIYLVFTGAGIFVFTGSGETGAQPNNGLVISRNPVIGQRFRFFCRSNSMTRHVGELIGLDESPVTAGSTFEFPTPRNGGELGVENIVGTHSLLPASEQGVYTCRIPLEGGEMRKINIGVYPSGFSSE